MLRTSIDFHNALQAGEIPVVYVLIETDKGNHFYSTRELKGPFEKFYFTGNGEVLGNGFITGGNGVSAIEKSNRLINTPNLSRTIQPRTRDYINSMTNRQMGAVDITIEDRDHAIAKALPLEPFLTKRLTVYVGFESQDFSKHKLVFDGKISRIEKTPTEVIIAAEER